MEAILMSVGVMTVIILSVVGLLKLPFKGFKEKHPKWFKATFTLLSIGLTFGVCLINQAFVLNSEKLFNLEFMVVLIFTYAGVFVSYSSYEGLGLKELKNRLFNSIKNIKSTAPESKLAKYIDKVGIDAALNIINAKQSELTKVEVENAVVEHQTINAEYVEINNAEVQNSTINHN